MYALCATRVGGRGLACESFALKQYIIIIIIPRLLANTTYITAYNVQVLTDKRYSAVYGFNCLILRGSDRPEENYYYYSIVILHIYVTESDDMRWQLLRIILQTNLKSFKVSAIKRNSIKIKCLWGTKPFSTKTIPVPFRSIHFSVKSKRLTCLYNIITL